MKIEHFLLLSEETQQELVMKKGSFLLKRTTQDYRIYLYQLFGFYVELVFPKRGGELEWHRAFEDIESLEPYLNKIDVDELL